MNDLYLSVSSLKTKAKPGVIKQQAYLLESKKGLLMQNETIMQKLTVSKLHFFFAGIPEQNQNKVYHGQSTREGKPLCL